MDGPIQIGDWRKISDLGSGAFGVVSLWKNNASDDYIAIKKCKFQTNTSLTAKQKERWNNEVQIMKTIKHPNIVKYKYIPDELEIGILKHNPTKLPLLPMEYCRKGNLRRVLSKPKNISGLQEEDIRYILEDVCNGLQHLHNLNITHRDIKPDNIVLQYCDTRKGNTIYKIIDLGYAKELNDTVVSFVGTLHYLAPEIFQTEQYNSCVDYWSMGILTFEVICGVLPFLPHLSPFERFAKIKNKGPNDICIYLSYSGNITYSSEIKKENYISNSLKQYLEQWLQHVLQFNPTNRSANFPNDIKVFDYLRNILCKRMVVVFSVHKLEFYSYEINESTLLSTLKDWISRDIKIAKNDLIMLFDKNTRRVDDQCTLVVDILKDDKIIYVFKRGVLINDSVTYCFPKLLRELFNSAIKFDMRYIKPLYSQTIYYVTVEKAVIESFKEAFNLFLVYLENSIEDLKCTAAKTSENVLKLLTQIECYNSIRKNNVCDLDLNKNQEYKDCLIYRQRLLDSLDRGIKSLNDFNRKNEIVTKRQVVLGKLLPDIVELVKCCSIEQQYTKAVTLLEKTNKPNMFTSAIKDIVSETIKTKDKLLHNKKFKCFLSAMSNVCNSIDNLYSWIMEFNSHIFNLENSFKQSEIAYRNIIFKAAENHNYKIKSDSVESLNGELLNLPTSYLIQENQNLGYKFEEILSQSILAHKNYVESVKDYILS